MLSDVLQAALRLMVAQGLLPQVRSTTLGAWVTR